MRAKDAIVKKTELNKWERKLGKSKMLKKRIGIGLLLVTLGLSGCGSEPTKTAEPAITIQEDGKLVIYYAENHMNYNSVLADFYNDFKDVYDIKLVPFETEELLSAQLQMEMAEGIGLDVVLTTPYSDMDIYKMAQNGYLENLSNYMEADSEFQEENYYMPVLDGGTLLGEQYLMPFTFTIDTLYLYEDAPKSVVSEEINDFSAMLGVLGEHQKVVGQEKISLRLAPLYNFGGLHTQLLMNSGLELVNEDGQVNADLSEVTTIMDYLISYRDELMEKSNVDVEDFQVAFEKFGSIDYNINFILGCIAFAEECPETEKEAVMHTLPWKNVDGKAQPTVVNYGYMMANSDCKEGAYEVLRYVMDYESTVKNFVQPSISVRRKEVETQIEKLGENRFKFINIKGIKKNTTETLTEEQKEAIHATLENMDTAIVYHSGYYQVAGRYLQECLMEEDGKLDVEELRSRLEEYLED